MYENTLITQRMGIKKRAAFYAGRVSFYNADFISSAIA
jgi:hypothetical protein